MIHTNYGSHVHVLARAASLLKPGSRIVELGAGYFSTPMLHGIAQARGCTLLTVETSEEWAAKFTHLAAPWHPFDVGCASTYWLDSLPALVFVDCSPTESREPLFRMAWEAGVPCIIAHDSNREAYGWGWERYPDAVHYETGDFHTTVVRQ